MVKRRPPAGPRFGRFGELLPTRGFSRRPSPNDVALGGSMWIAHDGLAVISSRTEAYLPGTDDTLVGPHWHLSVTTPFSRLNRTGRATNAQVAHVAEAFGLPSWDEDNHHPGAARHLWCPEDPAYREACECKATEINVVEDDGYLWTTPTNGPCRGCEFAELTRGMFPCTRHCADCGSLLVRDDRGEKVCPGPVER